MKTQASMKCVYAIALLLVGGLSACSDSNKTAGQKVDEAVATTERKATEAKAEMQQGATDLKDAAAQVATNATKAIGNGAITTAVNIALAKDKNLSALKIDVDTQDGRVALMGSAPNTEAKEHATQLAAAVEGVKSVDNRLVVR